MGKMISIVIVNYRTAQLTIDCLESIREDFSSGYSLNVVVADNNSGDGSAETIAETIKEKSWEDWATLLSLDRNGGFAYGNNRVIEKILSKLQRPDYLWLLNPDTVVHKGAIAPLVEFLDAHPRVGIVGSRLENPDGTPQVSAFRDHSVVSELLLGMQLGVLDALLARWIVAPSQVADAPHQTDWVSGASMLIRREVFDQIGLLDERYFMYFEEVDFCLQARRADWECWYVPDSRVVHLVGAASGMTGGQTKMKRRPIYWLESRHRYFLKNQGKLAIFLADSLWMLCHLTWRFRRIVQRKPDLLPPHFLRDFFRQSVFCRGFGLD